MQMLFLEIHIDTRFSLSLHELAARDLATYDEKIEPIWETLDASVWNDLSSERTLHSIAVDLVSQVFQGRELGEMRMPVYICAGADASADVLFALAEEVEEATGHLPVLFGVLGDPETGQVSRTDLTGLPPHLRFMVGDIVVLRLDVWSSRDERDEGEAPDASRGTRIRVVYRQDEDKGSAYFVGIYAEEIGHDLPVPVILPWVLAIPEVLWQANPPDPSEEGAWSALSRTILGSRYGLISWYIEIDERLVPDKGNGLRALPFFNGYTVDARLREFRRPTLTEFISFDSFAGQLLLLDMYTSGVSTASVPFDSDGEGFYRSARFCYLAPRRRCSGRSALIGNIAGGQVLV